MKIIINFYIEFNIVIFFFIKNESNFFFILKNWFIMKNFGLMYIGCSLRIMKYNENNKVFYKFGIGI